jgi:hypothetical protein
MPVAGTTTSAIGRWGTEMALRTLALDLAVLACVLLAGIDAGARRVWGRR